MTTLEVRDARKAARRWGGVDPARSRQMSLVRGKDTGPELIVRRVAHGLGYRYGLHRTDLPGMPDLVFRSRKKIIFVHGCFWHGHACAKGARTPKTNRDYWIAKISKNAERDARHMARLEGAHWRVLIIWECEMKDTTALASRLRRFLGPIKSSLARSNRIPSL